MKKRFILILFSLVFLLSACGKNNSETNKTEDSTEPVSSDDMFTSRDLAGEYDDAIEISLKGDSAACSSKGVDISDGCITISEGDTYILSGEYVGMIVVDTDKESEVQLVLNGVNINSETSAAIYVLSADKVFITLSEGTENSLTNGGEFVAIDDNNIDGTIFSKDDLTFNGTGSIKIDSPAGHGVVGKDDIVFAGGCYEITAASHGVNANDSVRIIETRFTVVSGKDGIKAENNEDESLGYLYIESGSFNINAEGDGFSASAYMQIDDGEFNVVTGGGYENAVSSTASHWGGYGDRMRSSTSNLKSEDSASIKGFKANGDLTVTAGTFKVDSADDSFHSNSSIYISGGEFDIYSGDDGMHADSRLTITDGNITINESYEGLEGQSIVIEGGSFTIYADDDGLNAAAENDQGGFGGFRGNDIFSSYSSYAIIEIRGGEFYINAGGDALDSNNSLTISGGNIIVSGPTSGDTSILDFESEGIITGGTYIATGSNPMSENFDSSSTQGVISVSSSGSAETKITLADSSGNTIIEHTTDQSFTYIMLSCPEIEIGETYTLMVGSSKTTITMSSVIYTTSGGGMGGMNGMGEMGGMGGMMR